MNIYNRYLEYVPCKTLDMKHYPVLHPEFNRNKDGTGKQMADIRKMIEAPIGYNLAYIFYNDDDPCSEPIAELMQRIKENEAEICRIRMQNVELPFLVQIKKDNEYTRESGPGGLVVAINKFEPAGSVQ